MARDLRALLWALRQEPQMIVGHSAGAAIAARLCLDGHCSPRAVVGLNAAMLPLGGVAGPVFSPVARLLTGVPLLPELFAWRARAPGTVERLLRDTGSKLDPRGVALYRQVVRQPGHVAGALGMMAHWDLAPLAADLPRLQPRLLLITGDNDQTIAPADSARVQALVPNASLSSLPGLGHLAHEEDPSATHRLIRAFAVETGILPGAASA